MAPIAGGSRIKVILLDSGPLGKLAHPRPAPEIASWLRGILASGHAVVLPEVADYEIRRSLLHRDLHASLLRLDALRERLLYLPLTTPVVRHAALLWANARRAGTPTADPKELDCDVLLAAQALAVGAIVATENVGHLARFVDARHWREITPD